MQSALRKYPAIDLEIHAANVHGLPVLIVPRPGFQRRYAAFSTRYGGNDLTFVPRSEDRPLTTPTGIAHFLEHQLFDQPEGNILQRLSALGASPNAYTGSAYTVYHLSLVDGFETAVDLLLDFVQQPAFTPESVAKEQGIIEQEIRIYADRPQSRLYEDLLRALYVSHPVREPILGTVEDIRRITPELLHTCHRTFYHPDNMLLTIIGDVESDRMLELVAHDLAGRSYSPPEPIRRLAATEPDIAAEARTERTMATAQPYVAVGIKLPPLVPWSGTADGTAGENGVGRLAPQRQQLLGQLALDAVLGSTTEFYQRLYDEGVITGMFSYQLEVQPGATFVLAAGRTPQPQRFADALRGRLLQAAADGIGADDFERSRRAALGSFLAGLDNPDALNWFLVRDRLLGFDYLQTGELLATATAADASDYLAAAVDEDAVAVAQVLPLPEGGDDHAADGRSAGV